MRLLISFGFWVLGGSFHAFGDCVTSDQQSSFAGKDSLFKAEIDATITKGFAAFVGKDFSRADVMFLYYDLTKRFNIQQPNNLNIDSLLKVKGDRVFMPYSNPLSTDHLSDSLVKIALTNLADASYFYQNGKPSIEWLNTLSQHCSVLSVNPSDLVARIRDENLSGRPYNSLHALIHLTIAIQNNCLNKTELVELQDSLCKRAELIFEEFSAEDSKTRTNNVDLSLESIAFSLFGSCPHIDKVHMQWVIDNQNPDGGWHASSKYPEMNHHASILALWALLEYNTRNHEN